VCLRVHTRPPVEWGFAACAGPDPAQRPSRAERASAARPVVRAPDVAPGPWSLPEALRDPMGKLVVAGQLTRIGRTFA